MKLDEQIRHLLTESAHSALPMTDYAALFNGAVEEYRSTRTIPLTELRDVYKVRAQINRNNGSPMAGFDDLLHQMDLMTDEQVYISVFLVPAGRFIFFTDILIEKLIGVLFTPIGEVLRRQAKRAPIQAVA